MFNYLKKRKFAKDMAKLETKCDEMTIQMKEGRKVLDESINRMNASVEKIK